MNETNQDLRQNGVHFQPCSGIALTNGVDYAPAPDAATAGNPNPKKAFLVYVGIEGDLKVDLALDGSAITFAAVAGGAIFPVLVKKVYGSGTTAMSLVAVW